MAQIQIDLCDFMYLRCTQLAQLLLMTPFLSTFKSIHQKQTKLVDDTKWMQSKCALIIFIWNDRQLLEKEIDNRSTSFN